MTPPQARWYHTFIAFLLLVHYAHGSHDYNITRGTRWLGGWTHLVIPSLEQSFLNGAGSFLDPKSPVVSDTLWVMTYSVIFGVLGGAVVATGFFFIPLQLIFGWITKNTPEYSLLDRWLTRFMLIGNIILILPLSIVGMWATVQFYFNVDDPIVTLNSQLSVLKGQYDIFYQNAYALLDGNPSYDIMPPPSIDEFYSLLSNGSTSMVAALNFGHTWVIRGAVGGIIPYTFPFFTIICTIAYLITGKRWIYALCLLITLISLFCMMGVVIPNSAWSILVAYECDIGVHSTASRYLAYYNPNSCVPDVAKSYIWMDPFTNSCMPYPWTFVENKIAAAHARNPSGNAAFQLAYAEDAWKIVENINRTNDLYFETLDMACLNTSNRGASLFFVTVLLWVYLLLHMYVLLFSTDRLKEHRSYVDFQNEKALELETKDGNPDEEGGHNSHPTRSTIRERLENQRKHYSQVENGPVLWMGLGYSIVHGLTMLFIILGFAIGASHVIVTDP